MKGEEGTAGFEVSKAMQEIVFDLDTRSTRLFDISYSAFLRPRVAEMSFWFDLLRDIPALPPYHSKNNLFLAANLFSTALNTWLSAAVLSRLCHTKEPQILLRSSIELAAGALDVTQNPEKYDAILNETHDFKCSIKVADAIFPGSNKTIGRVWGVLSRNAVHGNVMDIFLPNFESDKSTESLNGQFYESERWRYSLNVHGLIDTTLILTSMIEYVFHESVEPLHHWRIEDGNLQFSPSEEIKSVASQSDRLFEKFSEEYAERWNLGNGDVMGSSRFVHTS